STSSPVSGARSSRCCCPARTSTGARGWPRRCGRSSPTSRSWSTASSCPSRCRSEWPPTPTTAVVSPSWSVPPTPRCTGPRGRGKRSLEDHFDRSFELEYYLEVGGKFDLLKEMREIAEIADIHYVRQGEPRGLGHAVGVARQHVGDEPFAVLLGDDIFVQGTR